MTCPKRAAPVARTFDIPALRQARILRAPRAPQVLGYTPEGDPKQLGYTPGVFSPRRPEAR
jgi:hypothetical protein